MKQEIPYITLSGESAPRSEENIVKFESATAIIKNKDTGLYLALEFIHNEFGLVGGSVEKGEQKDDTMIREVEEESGYKNAKIVSIIFEKAYGRGYKIRKNREEEALDKVYLVEVEEKNKSDVLGADVGTKGRYWFLAEEMLQRLTMTHHVHYFKQYLKTK